MRFSAVIPLDLPDPPLGSRYTVQPDWLYEEWPTEGRGHRTPQRIHDATEPRVGVVLSVEHAKRGGWTGLGSRRVVLEDPVPHLATVAAILSVTGDTIVAPVLEVTALLEYLADRTLRTEQLPHVALAVSPHLRRLFPELVPIRPPREYDTEAEYLAWADGVAAVTGGHRTVPPPLEPVDAGPGYDTDPAAVIEAARRRLREDPDA